MNKRQMYFGVARWMFFAALLAGLIVFDKLNTVLGGTAVFFAVWYAGREITRKDSKMPQVWISLSPFSRLAGCRQIVTVYDPLKK